MSATALIALAVIVAAGVAAWVGLGWWSHRNERRHE